MPVWLFRAVALSILSLTVAGCAQNHDGADTPIKQSWDSPPTNEELQNLRHRLIVTQSDH
jgi:hypothetical protein